MSIDDAKPEDWDKLVERYYDNREFPKDVEPECTLIRPEKPPTGKFDWDRYAPNPDQVNSPSHYTHGDIECIDAIDAMLGRDGSFRYYEGTMLKYLWRWRYKGGVESLRKLRFFVDRLIEREVQGG